MKATLGFSSPISNISTNKGRKISEENHPGPCLPSVIKEGEGVGVEGFESVRRASTQDALPASGRPGTGSSDAGRAARPSPEGKNRPPPGAVEDVIAPLAPPLSASAAASAAATVTGLGGDPAAGVGGGPGVGDNGGRAA
eukprot:CAMPEP_0172166866 /NCGR_PEP_ID=MMETSP1050-20130122/9244_1 /TAXON_ID=233186 /ORGANISM="Cryptomonas curvata, Strain CCAP979/52" /LENGTH=139 /DNA_ID=CAMNT_0012837573 /DNA_START=451 /DNA_END=867 /DNA_ORIENTATION=-